MIHSETYQNYRGPPLIKAILGKDDITIEMKILYGENYNWNGCLWTYKEIFGEKCVNQNYRFDFKGEDGRDHWFHGFITDINQYCNPPLATPVNHNL